jgi:hypothetical protein
MILILKLCVMSRLVTCVGRSVPWDVLCRGTFRAVGRSVPWDVLCRGTFCAVGGFVPCMGHFESRTFCVVGYLVPWDI